MLRAANKYKLNIFFLLIESFLKNKIFLWFLFMFCWPYELCDRVSPEAPFDCSSISYDTDKAQLCIT